jgi:hypothetical protein
MTVAAGTIDCSTTGANGLDTGSLANSTWYHVNVIGKLDGTTALLASASFSSPTLPSGYTLKRRIGSFKTDGSAHIITFLQDGDEFRWKSSVQDISVTNPGTSAVTRTLPSVPSAVRVQAILGMVVVNTGGGFAYTLITDLSADDQAPSSTVSDTQQATIGAAIKSVWTNTSQQVRSRHSFSDASTGLNINVIGWRDPRGKDA